MPLCHRRPPDLSCLRRAGFLLLAVLGMSLLAGSGARAAAITFAPPVSYDVPGGGGITPVDLDGDGKLDMVVTGAQGMFFFYGKGDGTLEPAVVVPIVAGWTIAADVNGDGLPDLIAVRGDDSVFVMMNQGQRQFAAPVAYPVGHGPSGVAAGDFLGNGELDLAVANIGSNNMGVLLNNGDGTFGPAVFTPSGSGARVILTADLNGDGNLDLVMGQDSSFIVYLGDGKGGFTASANYPTGGGYPGMTLIDDFNGDGIPDVSTANTFSNNVSLFLGDGHGGFFPPAFYGTIQYPHVFASADLDEDGAPDIAVPHNGTSAFSVLQNQGNGAFLPAVTFDSGGSNTRMLGIGDFNGDGLPDVVTDNESSNTVSVLINTTPRLSPALRSLTLDTTSPLGGYQEIHGVVTLTAPAPVGGAVVTLATNNPAVNVPPTVTIPEGQTTAGIVLGTTPVAVPRRGNVTASTNGTVKRIAVSVRAPAARFVVVSPSPLTGGQPATGKVVYEAPAGPNGRVVTLSSSNPAVVKVPATVTIPAGQSSVNFPFVTSPVSVPTTVVVSATAPGAVTAAVLKVIDLGVPLPAVNGTAAPPVYNPANGHWYQEVQGPGLTWAQARDAAAALSYAGLPGHLLTLNSFNEDQFIVNNVPNSQSGTTHWIGGYQDHLAPGYSEPTGGWRWVTGEPWSYTNWNGGEPNNAGGEDFLHWLPPGNWNDLPGGATITGFLVEYEPFIPPLLDIALAPVSTPAGPTAGGQKVSGTVTLAQPAGPNPVTIYLASDHPAAIAVPVTLTVSAGQSSATFTATVYPVAADSNVVLAAAGPTASATVTVPLSGLGLLLPAVNGTASAPVYNPANGHWYQEVQGPGLTWAQARDAAAALSYAGLPGHLATVGSYNEDQFVLNNVPDAQSGTTHWVGGYQDRFAPDYSEPAGGWRWVTGEPWSFANWSAGEPNNAGGVEDFVQWLWSGAWNDLPGAGTITGYLVEYEPAILRIAPSQVTLTPNPVTGGQSTTGTVTLSQPAGANGLTIYLNSDHPVIAVVPPSVQIPAGQSTAGFTVTTSLVAASTIVQITADAPAGNATAPLTVNDTGVPLPQVDGNAAPPVYDPANGHWYQEVQGPGLTWAQARDAAAALSYAGLPGHLTTVTSSDEVRFILNNLPDAQSGTTHWIGGYQDRFAPDYSEPTGGWRWVTGEKWDYTNWNGGEPNNAGGVEDFLHWLPSGVWNDLPGAGTITGYLVEYEPAILRIAPSQVTLTPNPVTGGQSTTGTVTLSQAAGPNGLTVYLNSDHPLIAAVPPSVQIPAGQSTADFTVATSLVAASTIVQITADAPAGNATAPLTVNDTGVPLPQPAGTATLPVYNPANGHWYQSVQTTGMTWQQVNDAVSALSYAGLPGHLVTLTTADETRFVMTFVARPNTEYWFGAYQDRAAPDYSEPAGGWRWVTGEPWGLTNWRAGEPNDLGGDDLVQMKEDGTWNDVGAPGWMNSYLVEYELPIPQFAARQVTITPNPVTGGQSATGTVTLSQVAGAGGISVSLGSSRPEVAAVPPTVIVPAGQTTAAFTVTTNPVSVPTPVRISASGPTGSASVSLQVADSGAPLPQVVGTATPPIYNPDNGHWYQEVTVSGGLTWMQARVYAAGTVYAGYAGHLVTVTSGGEHEFLLSHLPNSTECWIGLYQDRTAPDYREPAGGWRWITGEPYAWNDWRGEPNNANGNEDWAVMRGTVGWNDLAITNLDYGYIIEYEAPPAPPAAPTTLAAATASTTQINLSWTDNSDNETGFEIQRQAAGGDWTKVTVTAASVNQFSDPGLTSFTHYTYRVRAVIGATASDWSNEAGGDTGIRGQMSLSRSGPLNFGTQTVGTASAAQTVTITNTGNGPLTFGGLTLAGNNASEFALVPLPSTPQTLAPGESGSVSLVFTPAGIGACSATLTLVSDAPGGPATLALTGSAIGPMARLSPTSLEFGPEPMGLNGTLAVLIQNNGNAALHVSRIAFQGANAGDFSLATDGVTGRTLQPGDISLLNVRFSPSATGARSADLVIADDAADSPQLVTLTGTGTAPLLVLSATGLIFSIHPAGDGSSVQTLTLTNNGDAPLNIGGLALTGPSAGSFHIISDSGEKSLAPGASRIIQISFSTASVASVRSRARIATAHIAAASYSATLEIKHNDPHPGSPHQIQLTAVDTGAVTVTAPAAPTGLTATLTPTNQVTLTWTDKSSNEKAFAIWRRTGAGAFVRVGVVLPNRTHFTDPAVSPRTSYTYEVRATNDRYASAWSNLTTITTREAPPAAPSGLTPKVVSPGEIDLTWTHGLGGETGVAIFRQSGSGAWQRIAELKPNATGYADRSAQPGASYRYRVRTHNSTQVSAWSNEAPAVTPLAPAGPRGLTATVISPREVDLAWTKGVGDETGVAIFRQSGSGAWQRLAEVKPSVTRYADRSAQPGGSYCYRVRSHDNTTVSAWSNEVPAATPLVLSATVTNLRASVVSPTAIDLTWTAGGSGATGIAIWRQAGSGPWQRIGVVKPGVTRYPDRSVQPRTSYTYRVRAHSSTQVSAWSNAVNGMTPATP